MPTLRHGLLCSAAALLLSAPGLAQGTTLDELRDELRESLRNVHFASGLTALVLVSDELELSATDYTIDREQTFELIAFSFPFQRTLRTWGDDRPGLHVEGVFGYARGKSKTDDLYDGDLPGSETAVTSRSAVFGVLGGAGPEFQLAEGLTFAPLLQLGISRIENDADYSGPGAEPTAALLDGIVFNWDALALTSGGAARVDWLRPFAEDYTLELLGRFDARWTRTISADDDAQEFTTRAQFVTLRTDVTGPTSVQLMQRPVRWRAFAGYRRFVEGGLFGVHDFLQLGGSLSVASLREVPVLGSLEISGAIVIGRDIEGWTAGIGGSF